VWSLAQVLSSGRIASVYDKREKREVLAPSESTDLRSAHCFRRHTCSHAARAVPLSLLLLRTFACPLLKLTCLPHNPTSSCRIARRRQPVRAARRCTLFLGRLGRRGGLLIETPVLTLFFFRRFLRHRCPFGWLCTSSSFTLFLMLACVDVLHSSTTCRRSRTCRPVTTIFLLVLCDCVPPLRVYPALSPSAVLVCVRFANVCVLLGILSFTVLCSLDRMWFLCFSSALQRSRRKCLTTARCAAPSNVRILSCALLCSGPASDCSCVCIACNVTSLLKLGVVLVLMAWCRPHSLTPRSACISSPCLVLGWFGPLCCNCLS
jgi:hypothetical protein